MNVLQGKKGNLAIYGILLFQLLLSIACILNGKMAIDEGIWSYIGRVWAEQGVAPYQGAVENKTPGIFILHFLSYQIFGINFIFPRVIGVISSLLTSYFIVKIGSNIKDQLTGLIAATLFFCSLLWSLTNGPNQANTEIFMVFFNVMAFYVLVKNQDNPSFLTYLLIGFTLGLAIGFKQIAILTFGGLVMYLIYRYRNRPRLIVKLISASSAGVLLSTFILLLPLLLSGVSILQYIEGAWLILFNDGSSYSLSLYRLARFFDTFFDSRLAIFYPILMAGLFSWSAIKQVDFIPIIVGWLIIALAGVNASGYYSGHQLTQLLPPLSIFCGIIVSYFSHCLSIRKLQVVGSAVILALLPYNVLFHNADAIINSKKPTISALKAQIQDNSEHPSIGKWVKENTPKSEKIYYYGKFMNPILSYSKRVSASKYFNTFFITNEAIKKKVNQDLKKEKPVFIIKEKGVAEKTCIETIIQKHYVSKRKTNCCIVFKRIHQ